MSHDPRAFRNALGWFTTGVAVVTTQLEGEAPIGITVNSFSSVSLDPALVLWCLDKGSDTLPVFEKCNCFTVNVLGEDQKDVSNTLARAGHHQLDGMNVAKGVNGCAKLEDALAVFECEVHARHDAGDHIILVGAVKAFSSAEEGRPLLYHRGGYQALAG